MGSEMCIRDRPEQIAAAVRMAVDAERTSEVEVISVRPSGMR